MTKKILSKEDKILAFHPGDVGFKGKLFGLPFNYEDSEVVIFPIPWEVTVSYRAGTANAPRAILLASCQIDLYDAFLEEGWKHGIWLKKENARWKAIGKKLRKKAERCIQYLEQGGKITDPRVALLFDEINHWGEECKKWIKSESKKLLEDNKCVGILGGDHSVSLGYMEALAEKYSSYGILHIDAHFDLRKAYEGFTYSHASILYNASAIKNISKIVHIGMRDFAKEEMEYVHSQKGRLVFLTDREIRRREYAGISWKKTVANIIRELPKNVYVSFDIDGLDPKLCPNTGTPVPGGFELNEIFFLFEEMLRNKKILIGFDLCEVTPGKDGAWDAIVGAHILYRLSIYMAQSQKKF